MLNFKYLKTWQAEMPHEQLNIGEFISPQTMSAEEKIWGIIT